MWKLFLESSCAYAGTEKELYPVSQGSRKQHCNCILSALILLLKQVNSHTQNNTPDDYTAIKSCDFMLSFCGHWVLGSFIAFSVFQRLETNYYLKISQSSLLLKDDLQQKLNYREHHCPQYINFCHSVTVKIYSRYNLFEGGSSQRKYKPSFK